MVRPRMAKFATIAIVLLACNVPRSKGIDPRRTSDRKTLAAGISDDAIRGIFRIISMGTSTEEDDEQLVKFVKGEIVRTAQSIKTPSGSIEATARRAQKLITEMTVAYTTAIYKSKSTEEARMNLARFQKTVQKIVDFIKSGQFVV